jgi:acid phosphatase (class A)
MPVCANPAATVVPSKTTPAKPEKPLIDLDLTKFLAPPPAQDSDETKAELKEVHMYQDTRTKDMVDYAKADQDKNIFRFADVMGESFTPDKLLLTKAFFDKVVKITKSVTDPAKKFYNRPRPYVFDPTVKPSDDPETSPSYPSGHATAGTVMAILLANMVPEKKAEIYSRGWKFGMNREIGGVHYRSDIESGRIAGSLIAEKLMSDKKFMVEFSKAKDEIRTAMGLEAALK